MQILETLKYYNPIDLIDNLKIFYGIQTELHNIFEQEQDNHSITSKKTHARHGSIKFPDAYIIRNILHQYKPNFILEIGSFLGYSTRWLLESSAMWNARVTAVDPNIRHRIFDNPKTYVEKLNSKFIAERLEIETAFFGEIKFDIYEKYSRSQPVLNKEQVDNLLKKIKTIDSEWNRTFDFIYIDGDHSYGSVIDNFKIAINLINKGGHIAFHDVLSWDDIYRALKDIESEYSDRIKLEIYGTFQKKLLKIINKSNDGIALITAL